MRFIIVKHQSSPWTKTGAEKKEGGLTSSFSMTAFYFSFFPPCLGGEALQQPYKFLKERDGK